MSAVQRVAQVFGVVFILVAILGFVASGSSMEADPTTAPKLLGLFAVNLLHNVVHLLFGVWGLMAARSFSGAKTFGMLGGAAFLLLAALGNYSPDMFGLLPLGGNDVLLHAALGVVLTVTGLLAKRSTVAA
jgi:DMSO/TMAO reductase YedYZ heme-binding membrane subunit